MAWLIRPAPITPTCAGRAAHDGAALRDGCRGRAGEDALGVLAHEERHEPEGVVDREPLAVDQALERALEPAPGELGVADHVLDGLVVGPEPEQLVRRHGRQEPLEEVGGRPRRRRPRPAHLDDDVRLVLGEREELLLLRPGHVHEDERRLRVLLHEPRHVGDAACRSTPGAGRCFAPASRGGSSPAGPRRSRARRSGGRGSPRPGACRRRRRHRRGAGRTHAAGALDRADGERAGSTPRSTSTRRPGRRSARTSTRSRGGSRRASRPRSRSAPRRGDARRGRARRSRCPGRRARASRSRRTGRRPASSPGSARRSRRRGGRRGSTPAGGARGSARRSPRTSRAPSRRPKRRSVVRSAARTEPVNRAASRYGSIELPLLERLGPVGGEAAGGVGRKPRAHKVVDRVAAGEERRPVARDPRLLAEDLDELVAVVAEPVALVDEVLVDVDPRRRVDRLGERAGT